MHTGTLQRPLCTHQPGYTHLDAVRRYEVWSHATVKFQTYRVRYVVKCLCVWDVGECNWAEFACFCVFWGLARDIKIFVALFHKTQLTSSIKSFSGAKAMHCMVNQLPRKELFSNSCIVNKIRLH